MDLLSTIVLSGGDITMKVRSTIFGASTLVILYARLMRPVISTFA